ncbi:MAG: hypothetical protein K1X75_12810 [Leptospirales bacterium]|nr:hypothetical protein [Leptospirales bacterium]
MRILVLAALLALSAALPACEAFQWSDDTRPRVFLTYQDKANRMRILISDLQLPAIILPPDDLPYSANASGAIWIGVEFPFDKAQQIIKWARNYYSELRYVALSDYSNPGAYRFQYELFIGGSTETAVRDLRLRAWTEADFRKLDQARNAEDFQSLIRSHYPADSGGAPEKPAGRR